MVAETHSRRHWRASRSSDRKHRTRHPTHAPTACGRYSNSRPLPCNLRNINHRRANLQKKKDLAHGPLDAGGRHGANFWRLDSTRTPRLRTRNGTWRAFARAVVGRSDCCLLEETTFGFHIRMMPMWSGGRASSFSWGCGLGNVRTRVPADRRRGEGTSQNPAWNHLSRWSHVSAKPFAKRCGLMALPKPFGVLRDVSLSRSGCGGL